MNTMMEFCCRDCGAHYYLVRRYWHEDTGLCAKCDNEIAELEEKYGPKPEPVAELRQVDEWKAFLQVIGALALAGFIAGCLARVEWMGSLLLGAGLLVAPMLLGRHGKAA